MVWCVCGVGCGFGCVVRFVVFGLSVSAGFRWLVAFVLVCWVVAYLLAVVAICAIWMLCLGWF